LFLPVTGNTCIYLSDSGCEVYARRPIDCREFDCRMYPATNILSDSDLPVYKAATNWNTVSAIHNVEDVRALAALLYANQLVTEKNPDSNAEHRAYLAMELVKYILNDTKQLNIAVEMMIQSSKGNPDAAAMEQQLLHNMSDGFTLVEALIK
jgi:Fe-S-cluster containining protein